MAGGRGVTSNIITKNSLVKRNNADSGDGIWRLQVEM